MMGEFDAIRPYADAEVPGVLARLLADPAFLQILTHFRFPRLSRHFSWLLKPLIAQRLRSQFAS
ncbi:MAG: glycerol acyltransferase, partial [Pseudomonas sp.]